MTQHPGITAMRKPTITDEKRLGGLSPYIVASSQAARPVPWARGMHRLSVDFISDLFNGRNEPVTRQFQTGKDSYEQHVVAINYYASYLGLLCAGPVDALHRLRLQDRVLVDFSAAEKLSGTAIGSAYLSVNAPDKAFDGLDNTLFQASAASGGWCGLDLGAGNARSIARIRYLPWANHEITLEGARIEGSNNMTDWVTLHEMPTVAAGWTDTYFVLDDTPFRYLRMIHPSDRLEIIDMEFYAATDPQQRTVGADEPLYLTVEGLGDLYFFWGDNNDQWSGDPAMEPRARIEEALGLSAGQLPTWKRLAWLYADDLFLGANVNSPSNLDIEFSAYGSRPLDISTHSIAYDAVLPEALYEFLTDPDFGPGIPASMLDKPSFEAMAEEDIARGIGYSPILSKTTTLRSFLAKVLSHGDYYLIPTASGKVGLSRSGSAPTIVSLDQHQHLERPSKEVPQWRETWSETHLSFTDRQRDFGDSLAIYEDAAALASSQGGRLEEVERPFITRAKVAAYEVERLGRQGAVPWVQCSGVVDYRHAALLQPGVVLQTSFPGVHDNDRIRLTRVEIGSPRERYVRYEGHIERAYLTADLTSVSEWNGLGLEGYQAASAIFRVASLTAAQRDGNDDGLLIAAARPNPGITNGEVQVGVTSGTTARVNDFASYGKAFRVNAWRQVTATAVALDISFTAAHEDEEFTRLVASGAHPELYVVTAKRTVVTSGPIDRHEVEPVWSVIRPGSTPTPHPLDPRRWLIDLQKSPDQGGTFYAWDGANGTAPTELGFLGQLRSFWMIPRTSFRYWSRGLNAPGDTNEVRFVKVISRTVTERQSPPSAPYTQFSPKDTTMSPQGTLLQQWNAGFPPDHDGYLGNNVNGEDNYYQSPAPAGASYRDPGSAVNA